ncbi:hypothetical protein [Spirosoma montaniterrae]|uniref:Uncharacterized protein n=1 Tax=Spirosoma montaniterrae TaxID=1178516 RepID=A0A1P9WYU4_9BACT|nr:hypothetical protein [Spirosoma montaniterrae]AQG80524.1 hypothetical protein AWR27_15060 [Spirosoma montaniterrae]
MNDPNLTPSTLNSDEQQKLHDLTTQSWNLELVISGAALFATLQIPALLNEGFDYFQYNLLSHTSGARGVFPVLVLSMIKATCYVLFLAFLVNFVMRAFWVGLVGLLAVYPAGVQYDRLPLSTPSSRKRMADELGPLDRYILQLDRRCNVVFAVAFLLVIFLFLIATAYVFLLGGYSVLQAFVPVSVLNGIKIASQIAYGVFMLTVLLVMIKKVREHPIGEKVHGAMMSGGKLAYLGMYKPYLFIYNTFSSNIPRKQLTQYASGVVLVLFAFIVVEVSSDVGRIRQGASLINQRHLFSTRVDSLLFDPNSYDNQRDPSMFVSAASVQADVIRDPYVRLYVAYPKALDTLLTEAAKEPIWNDSLSLEEGRRRRAEWSHSQIGQLLQIHVNDSLYKQPDFLFTELGEHQQRGWQTVLIPTNLKTGKNLIRVSVKTTVPNHPEELAAIPFWYVPEK